MITSNDGPVLCGYDFSEGASAAANVAGMIARALNVPLKLVYSKDLTTAGHASDATQMVDDYHRDRLQEVAHQLGRTGATIDPIISQGSPAQALVECIKEEGAQLLVLGWHGANSKQRIGSVAEQATGSSPVPALVVRDPEPLISWLQKDRALRILAGVDFTYCSEAALHFVAALHQIGSCEITATYFDKSANERERLGYDDPHLNIQPMVERDLREKIDEILGPNDAQVVVSESRTYPPTQLIDLAESQKSDLIVIGSHQRHGAERLLHSSVSLGILLHSSTNIACVPRPRSTEREPPLIFRCRRVLAAVDLTEPNDFTAQYAYSIVNEGGEVILVYNSLPNTTVAEQADLRNRFEKHIPLDSESRDITTKIEITDESDPASAICHAAERVNADVICLGSHHRPGLSAKVAGSVSLAVLQKCHRPILLTSPPK